MFERCTISQTASNQINMYWVGSNAVDVVSRAGVMHLAGVVDHARIRASGDSQLTVKQLALKTHGCMQQMMRLLKCLVAVV